MGNPGYDNVDLPGITSTYVSSNNYEMFSSTNLVILVFVMFIGALFYRRRNRNNIDDDYIKPNVDHDPYESLTDPFNRKKKDDNSNLFGSMKDIFKRNIKKDDKDDDYDHQV